MTETLRLMCILAHPDDESLGTGGILAKYAAEGVETYLITATRGERGWMGDEKDDPGLEALGRLRTGELQAAAQVLGLREVHFLDYIDGDLDQADPAEAIAKIVAQLRRVRPHVVVTFDPFGAYGHPDHIAISQFTQAAIVAAADPTYGRINGDGAASRGQAVLHGRSQDLIAAYQSVIGDITMNVDGVVRARDAVGRLGHHHAHRYGAATGVRCGRRRPAIAANCPTTNDLSQLPEEIHPQILGLPDFLSRLQPGQWRAAGRARSIRRITLRRQTCPC